jgi:LysM repeat protein
MNGTPEFYVVVEGDTLSEIAARHHVSLTQILEWNPQIKNKNLIHPKDRIRVVAPSEEGGEDESFQGEDVPDLHMSGE